LAAFLERCLPRSSCLPASVFTGQAFHRLAAQITDSMLQTLQVRLAAAIVERFELRTDVLAFDTTNFDTHIATTTDSELARRGHSKSKNSSLRVVGLGLLVSETEHVPLLYRTFPGNSSDQAVLSECLDGLTELGDALDTALGRKRPGCRTLVRDGGFWSPDLEHVLPLTGYASLIALPLGHKAAAEALAYAAAPRRMKRLARPLGHVRAARLRTQVGKLDRTLVVVESEELREGQKRGIAARLNKAREELEVLERHIAAERVSKETVTQRVKQILGREHLHEFVVAEIGGRADRPTLRWHVDAARRRRMEKARLGRRVLCTDRHDWGTERIVAAFRGQWKVEELFRRSKKGDVVPWGPSHQWTDSSLRLHTFCTVLGLMLVSLARVKFSPETSALKMLEELGEIRATELVLQKGGPGRPATVLLPPQLTPSQSQSVGIFELERWLPGIASCRRDSPRKVAKVAAG
jgi:transposase